MFHLLNHFNTSVAVLDLATPCLETRPRHEFGLEQTPN